MRQQNNRTENIQAWEGEEFGKTWNRWHEILTSHMN
jgi:hypothetical protein